MKLTEFLFTKHELAHKVPSFHCFSVLQPMGMLLRPISKTVNF